MRDRFPKRKAKEAPFVPPKVQAEMALQKLNEQHLIEKGLPQLHAAQLSSILLGALEGHLNTKLKEMTTKELADTFRNETTLSKDQANSILSFLADLDQIKFAKKIPSADEAKELEKNFHHIINTSFET